MINICDVSRHQTRCCWICSHYCSCCVNDVSNILLWQDIHNAILVKNVPNSKKIANKLTANLQELYPDFRTSCNIHVHSRKRLQSIDKGTKIYGYYSRYDKKPENILTNTALRPL